MSVLNLTEKEKKEILEKHKKATKDHFSKKEETKQGLKKPEDKKPTK